MARRHSLLGGRLKSVFWVVVCKLTMLLIAIELIIPIPELTIVLSRLACVNYSSFTFTN